MFTNLKIENFRSFPNLELPDLRSINLVTGMNGAGKSAALEAVFLNCQAGNASSALTISAMRGEQGGDVQNDRMFRLLFNALSRNPRITITGMWKTRKDDTTPSTRELTIKPITAVWKFAPPAASGEGSISGLEFDFKGGGVKSTVRMQWTEIPLQPQGQLPGMRSNAPAAQYTLRTDPINPPANIKTIFIVPAPREATGFLYQHLLNATREKNIPGIVNLASIVDKRITNLVPLVESGQGQVYADIGLDRLMPITVMGAGFSNMLQIAVAIVETKSQVIIIDEIEDGLHYTTYPQIAQALIRFATTVDVQFFLSTHSAEFLDAFVAVARSLDFSDVCSLRIADRSGRKVVTRFDASDLNNAKEIELDVR